MHGKTTVGKIGMTILGKVQVAMDGIGDKREIIKSEIIVPREKCLVGTARVSRS